MKYTLSTRKIIRNLIQKINNINKFIYTNGHKILSKSIKIFIGKSNIFIHTKVANKFLENTELSDNDRRESVMIVKYFHQSTMRLSTKFLNELGRHNYVTPKLTNYLFVFSYSSVLTCEAAKASFSRPTTYLRLALEISSCLF
jgi:hypothetical protein